MRGNTGFVRNSEPTMQTNRIRLLEWLYGAREDVVFATSAETLAQRHKLHRDPRQNAREVEAMLLARQDKLRRERAGR